MIKTKTAETKITKLGGEIVHHDTSGTNEYQVRGQGTNEYQVRGQGSGVMHLY